MTKNEKLAYLAGFTDGEGHFYKPLTTNGRGDKHRYSRIRITQKDITPLKWIKARFGGSIALNKHTGCSNWTLQGKKAEELARKLQPYLIVKKEQIKRII